MSQTLPHKKSVAVVVIPTGVAASAQSQHTQMATKERNGQNEYREKCRDCNQ